MKYIDCIFETLFKPIYERFEYENKLLNNKILHQSNRIDEMDKEIRSIGKTIKKDTKKEEKKLKSLEKADKKRDKVCDYGEKMMKKKK